ncbi:SM-like, degradation of cytoplasmic mRNAs and positively regulates transcription initiation [Aphanomyces cochlioides]|nr:SM-like, degradation of cytoplasmic mRNAs and positively regulates transcription initiation [Aphanomyces cochlioides]
MNAFPGVTSLVEQLDKQMLVVLRDGRHLVGMIRSFDQFSNIVLEETCERHVVGNTYCDIPLGLYIIRGENIVLMGELDQAKEAADENLVRKSAEEVLTAEMEQQEQGQATVRDAWNFDHPSQN